MLDRFRAAVGNSATTANANPISSLGNYIVPTVLVFHGISKYGNYRVSQPGDYERFSAHPAHARSGKRIKQRSSNYLT